MLTHLFGSKRHFFRLSSCRLDSNTPPHDLSFPVFFISIFMMPALLNAPLPRIFVRQQMIPLPQIDAINTGERAVHLNETKMATVMKQSHDVSRKPAALKLHLNPRHLSRSGVWERRNERKAIETGVEITGRGVGRLVGGPVGSWVNSSAGRIGNGAILRVGRESNTLDDRETGRNGGEGLRDCK